MALVSYESWYVGLLGVAETFRVSNPPKIRQCIQCLQAVFQFQAPPAIQAKTHLQIGELLRTHTKNSDDARTHLENAIMICRSLGSGYEELHVEAASILSEIQQEQGQLSLAKTTVRRALEVTDGKDMQFWQFRLSFRLAEIHALDKELKVAADFLGFGQEVAQQCHSYYMSGLFSLTQAMVFMIMKDTKSATAVLSTTGAFLERWQASDSHKEHLQCFYLLLNVWNLLAAGRAKGVRPYLKQLQQSIQVLTAMPNDESQFHEAERFRWLSKDSLCVLVYLATVVHSMYAGCMEKALKYSEKALTLVERMKGGADHGLLPIFQFTLMEHVILCRIVQGQLPAAIKEISQCHQVLQHDGRLLATKKPVLHTLLGLYAMAMNLMQQATAQFTVAFETCSNQELKNFIGLNLAIIYIRAGGAKQRELSVLLPQIRPDNLAVCSQNLQAAYYYVCGLQAFFQSRLQESKKFLRETLKIANAEDLNRLTACSLVLLGHAFLALGNPQEALNLVQPATQLAGKIPDSYIQLWAASLLRDLYGVLGNPALAAENYHLHHTCTKHLLESHLKATKLSEHRLIEWTGDSSCPRQTFPQEGGPSTLHHQPGTSGMMN